jgi:stage II sporulation protein M
LINGVAVGYVLALSSSQAGLSPLSMLLFGILPHGLLELPAIFLAGGTGMFLGLSLLRWLFGSGRFFSHLLGGMRQNWEHFWREQTLPVLIRRVKGMVRLALLLVVMLLGAAVIESFLTPLLLYLFVY